MAYYFSKEIRKMEQRKKGIALYVKKINQSIIEKRDSKHLLGHPSSCWLAWDCDWSFPSLPLSKPGAKGSKRKILPLISWYSLVHVNVINIHHRNFSSLLWSKITWKLHNLLKLSVLLQAFITRTIILFLKT